MAWLAIVSLAVSIGAAVGALRTIAASRPFRTDLAPGQSPFRGLLWQARAMDPRNYAAGRGRGIVTALTLLTLIQLIAMIVLMVTLLTIGTQPQA